MGTLIILPVLIAGPSDVKSYFDGCECIVAPNMVLADTLISRLTSCVIAAHAVPLSGSMKAQAASAN